MDSPDSPSPVRIRSIRDTSATDVPIDPSPRMRRRRILVVAAVVAAVAVLGAATFVVRSWTSTSLVIPRERVRIAAVVRGPFIRDVAAQGTVITANSPTLFAPATGTVTFNVRAGDRVTKNQVLGTVDSPNLVNEHAQEQATLDGLNVSLGRQDIEMRMQILKNREDSDQAGLQIHAAERELKRAEESWQQHLIPQRDYAKAHDDVDSAKLAYDHAIANEKLENERLQFDLRAKRLERDRQKLLVDNLTRRVDSLTIRSPVDGKVGSVAVDQKATVAENATLLTVVDLTALEIEFRVPESYAAELGIDMDAEVTYGQRTYKALVTSISPEVEQNEVKGRLRFGGAAPADLRQNQRVNVRIIMDSRDNVLKVERGAFVDSGGITYVIDGDMAKRRQIKLGPMGVGEVEILSGLSPGERIVISSLSDFNDALLVRLTD
jgi:HlyD family secretion protein